MEDQPRTGPRRRLQYVDPLRNPRNAPVRQRNLRGWILLLCSALLPGSAQSVLGARRRARLSLTITLGSWALLLGLALWSLFSRRLLLGFGTNPVLIAVLMVWVVIAAANWVLCMLDTVRRIRLVSLGRRTRGGLLAAALVMVLVVCGGTVWGTSMLNSQRALISDVFANGRGVKPVDGRYNIALFGSDAGKGRTGVRPDSLSVVSIDAKTGKSVVIGVPRNLENVPFPDGSEMKKAYPNGFNCGDECLINAVYQAGEQHKKLFSGDVPAGVQATEQALQGVTGLPIQYYAMIDLKGFQQLIDAMGGITLTSKVRVPISSKVNPATGRHGKPLGWIEPGENIHLDGRSALWYARSREFASDYARMVRQRCVQEAMLKQMDPTTLIGRFQDIAKAAPNVVSTDIPEGQVNMFVDLALKAKSQKMDRLNLTPPLITPSRPDIGKIHSLVGDAIAQAESDAQSAGSPLNARPDAYEALAPAGSGQAAAAAPAGAQDVRAASTSSTGKQKDDASICSVS
ncbi:LytR family transcriptional regulator [Brevibacterium sp. 5221]|uniref:LytR family transcriptional regulator n=1 Tax=Brevibacterium rongguiense TaxID=2695267 RepID=A0A6N9HA66_9MICO|nr:LCP family protein [Brevibacterium rongguiense]MYM20414.1 LytR family transcriptional regulator [Brevibacterium rongguiense]